ncbi:SDR family NAD(P)-dependent oxidoreductase [Streptomyces sp. HNM1019]|uniref:SDR family NAD(P)-dependent oxidoreductase n=1 Tax=Streptomyces sp. HNM1019 TaxID=3424717 RepID=UPI003D76D8E5
MFLIPAGSPAVLPGAARRIADWLEGDGADTPLPDIAHTLALRHAAGRGRLGVTTASRAELVSALRAFADGRAHPAVVTGAVGAAVSRRPIWVFSGQGSQWPGMGRRLLATEPAFAEALAEADAPIAAESGFSVLDIVRRGAPVTGCERVQPVLFALQTALAATWRAHGVEPAGVIGHSMGEVAAAVVAGALSLADGAKVICRRSALLTRVAGDGAMATVGLGADEVRAELDSDSDSGGGAEAVTVAVMAAPGSTVVAGDTAQVERLVAGWQARSVPAALIAVDVASHSPQVDPLLADLRTALADLEPRRPEVPFYTTVLDDPHTTPAFDADYWCANLRHPVRFSAAVAAAAADRHLVYVEISPHPVITHPVLAGLAGLVEDPVVLPTLRREEDEPTTFRTQLAALHCAGVPVDWSVLYADGALADVPPITFDRTRHWADAPPPAATGAAPAGTLPGAHLEVPGEPVRHSWRARTGTAALPWLDDHRVHGAPVLPGAASYALALTAACEVFGAGPEEVEVTDLRLRELLRLADHTDLSTTVTVAAADRAECEIHGRDEDGAWVRQATAVLRRLAVPPRSRAASVRTLALRHPAPIETEALYANLRARGVTHGAAFQGLTEVSASRHGNSFWARVAIPEAAREPGHGLRVHPVLVDLCAQLLIAGLLDEGDRRLLLPARMRCVRVLGDPQSAVYCHARLAETTPGATVGHVRLLDADGRPVLAIDGLRIVHRAAERATEVDQWFLEVGWRRAARPPATRAPGRWLVVGEADGTARPVAAALRVAGATARVWDVPLADQRLDAFRDALANQLTRPGEQPRAVVLVSGPRPAGGGGRPAGGGGPRPAGGGGACPAGGGGSHSAEGGGSRPAGGGGSQLAGGGGRPAGGGGPRPAGGGGACPAGGGGSQLAGGGGPRPAGGGGACPAGGGGSHPAEGGGQYRAGGGGSRPVEGGGPHPAEGGGPHRAGGGGSHPAGGDGSRPAGGGGACPAGGGGSHPAEGGGPHRAGGDGSRPAGGGGSRPVEGEGPHPAEGGGSHPAGGDGSRPAGGGAHPAEGCPQSAEDGLRRTCRLLAVAQVLTARFPEPPRLYAATSGAHAVTPGDLADPGQSALRGLLRVLALEHPELRAASVDTDPAAPDQLADTLAAELLADGPEDEIALRDGARYAAELDHAPLTDTERTTAAARTVRCGTDGFRLRAGRLGDLGSLELTTTPRRPPGPGEVELRVLAAGLNFRDVLTAMGLLPGDGDEDVRYRLGFECAAEVSAVGPGVDHLRAGDRVVAADVHGGAFGSFTVVPVDRTAPLPDGLDPHTAAGLPIAFLTAWYALRHIGRVTAGERVLIHSATGGTGLAAIAVARLLGAEVLATAGSEEKRRFLRGMGIARVMDSRSLDFRDEIMASTGGEGVDVVLNSLSGAAIRAGLECLRPFGRFVELGVRDILSDAPLGLSPLRHNITFATVDLRELQLDRPREYAAMLRDVLTAIGDGRLKPLRCTTYPLAEVTDAFRQMAGARHIGKLVLTIPQDGQLDAVLPDGPRTVRDGGTYIVTGGLRGLGLATARWLARRGAGHLVLNGRTAPVGDAARTLAELSATGTRITVVTGDIARPGTAERLVAAATADAGASLHGVVHSAMVLDDAAVANVREDQLRRVWAPKATGAWQLHRATEGHRLDWFAVYSSMASLLGNAGQGAYAAANAWLDGFAAWRSARGLPTLAVNWGPWGETGVATGFADRGYQTIPTDEGLRALGTLLAHRRVRTGVIPGEPATWIPATGRRSPLFAPLLPGDDTPAATREDTDDIRARLAALPAGPARRTALESYLTEHIRAVLRLSSTTLDPRTPLTSLGFDSLLAMELRVRLEAGLSVKLAGNFVWRHPTVEALAAALAQQLRLDPADRPEERLGAPG